MFSSERKLISFLFLFLLIVNAAVRLFEIGDFSLSNDELSAVSRLTYDSFNELIQEGVVRTDPHPAGAQVFLFYWTKAFGLSVFSLRFPFVLCSLLALVFFFHTFRFFLGDQRALLAITVCSMMEFSIIHAQLARPYAMALLFVAVFTWSQTKIIFENSKKPLTYLLFIISGSLALYTHYFAAFLTGIIGLTGIYPAILRKNWKIYITLGISIALLFLPHLSITLKQLGRDSITLWIPTPESDFLFNHISTLLNQSTALIFLILSVFLYSFFHLYYANKDVKYFALISFILFTSPMAIGYVYSLRVEPVLMDRVLFFSSPFFFSLVFSASPLFKRRVFVIVYMLLMGGTLVSTFFQTDFLKRDYVENFKELASDLKEAKRKYDGNLFLVGNFNSLEYLNFYLDDSPVHWDVSSIQSDMDLGKLMKQIRECKKEYVALFYACKYQSVESIEYIRRYYPSVVKGSSYYNSGMWLFSSSNKQRDTLLSEMVYNDTIVEQGVEFLNIYKTKRRDIANVNVLNVLINVEGEIKDGLHLVYSATAYYGKSLFWVGKQLSDFEIEGNENEIFASFLIEDDLPRNADLSIYLWNPGSVNLKITKVELSAFSDSNYDLPN